MWRKFSLRYLDFVGGGCFVTNAGSIWVGRAADVGELAAGAKFRSSDRIQTSILAGGERALLDRLCRLTPGWVTPDHLTAVGTLGAVLCGAGYVVSNWRPGFLFLASLGLLVNWFGDSLDGSLARHRKTERPRYGYFLDHSVDAINNLIFAVGLGLSPYVSIDAALFLLVSYYLLSMYVFLSNQVLGEFRLSFLHGGPTELRLVAIGFNLLIFVEGPLKVSFIGATVSLYTLLVGLEGAIFVAIFIYIVVRTAKKLRRQDEGFARRQDKGFANWRRDRSVPYRG
jgi:phosphatidylglycerophosphate synthase